MSFYDSPPPATSKWLQNLQKSGRSDLLNQNYPFVFYQPPPSTDRYQRFSNGESLQSIQRPRLSEFVADAEEPVGLEDDEKLRIPKREEEEDDNDYYNEPFEEYEKDISSWSRSKSPFSGYNNVMEMVKNPDDDQNFYYKKPFSGNEFDEAAADEKIDRWNKIAKYLLPNQESLHNAYRVKDQPGILYPEVIGKRAGSNFEKGVKGANLYNALKNRGISHSDLFNNPSNAIILGKDYGGEYEDSIFPLDMSAVELDSDFEEKGKGPIFL